MPDMPKFPKKNRLMCSFVFLRFACEFLDTRYDIHIKHLRWCLKVTFLLQKLYLHDDEKRFFCNRFFIVDFYEKVLCGRS